MSNTDTIRRMYIFVVRVTVTDTESEDLTDGNCFLIRIWTVIKIEIKGQYQMAIMNEIIQYQIKDERV